MSYRVRKLTVGRGRTHGSETNNEWVREYYELEIEVPDEHELSIAKEACEGLLNEWLGITGKHEHAETVAPKAEASTNLPYDTTKINWQPRQGPKGAFEISEDYGNADHQALLKFLSEYAGGCVSSKTHFYWTFDDKKTIGRKLKAGKQGTEPSKPVEEASQKTSLLFPEDLRSLLSFEQKDDAVILKPTRFLGSENFAKIAQIVKDNGGDYVSAGKASHFKISLKKE